MSDFHETDFWWIEEQHRSLYIGVGHHEPLTDDDDPRRIQWFHSIENECLSQTQQYHPLAFIDKWRIACNHTNVYRSLTLFDNNGQPVVLGPFLIDIDNSQLVKNGYKEDLEDALKVAQTTVRLLKKQFQVQENDLRVFFSGRKGFNIEVQPSSLGINMDDTADAQVKCSATKLYEITNALRDTNGVGSNATTNAVSAGGTVVDSIYGSRFGYSLKHPCIRLHESINSWIPKGSNKMARRKIGLSPDELFSSSVKQICQKAADRVSISFSCEP